MEKSMEHPFTELDKLLGPPVLLKHEDEEMYAELQKAVERHLKPTDLFAALRARDIVDSIWGAARFKSHAAELVKLHWRKALQELASPKSALVSERVAKLIEKYLAAPEKAGRMTQNGISDSQMLRQTGLSATAVEAHSVMLARDSLLVMDKLVANRNAIRDASLKAFEKREAAKEKRRAAKEKRLAAKAKRRAASGLKSRHLVEDDKPTDQGKSAWD